MTWEILDHTFWQTLVTFIALSAAFWVGYKQIKIQDTVEMYASFLIVVYKNEINTTTSEIPYLHVQNVGTRLVYLDKYIFNGREYITDSQILPSTYSQAENSFYRIQLPTNDDIHVSLEVFYHDLDDRKWCSKIFASKAGPFGWNIKTLPRVKVQG